MLRRLYLSPAGFAISVVLNLLSWFHRPFMIYGYFDRPSRRWRRNTRISSTAVLGDPATLSVADDVWVGHQSIIDASNGVTIGEGTQVSFRVGIFSHGSQVALRLHGRSYIHVPHEQRIGYTRAPVTIGRYCYLGTGAIILPGTTLGDGCLVSAGAIVTGDVPAFSILRGIPAKIVGDVREMDARFWNEPGVQDSYFDSAAMHDYLARHSAPGSE